MTHLLDFKKLQTIDSLEENLKAPLFENIKIPESFGPVEILVDDYAIKRFAFIQDNYHDWYLKESPLGKRIAPAGIISNSLLQMFTTVYAPSDVVGLHTEEELHFHAPIPIDTNLILTAAYTEKFVKREQGYVIMEADATDREGNKYITHRGTEIMRTEPGKVGGRGKASVSDSNRVSTEFDISLPFANTILDGNKIGQALTPINKTITFEQAALFSRYGENVINIHNNVASARQAGLRVPIVQGQQMVSSILDILVRYFGMYWFDSGRIRMKFLRPVPVFENLKLNAAIREVETQGQESITHLHTWVTDKSDRLCAIGWASCMTPTTVKPHRIP